MLCVLANDLGYSRFGFAVNSRIGNAVVRNRIKRRLREAMRLRMGSIAPGWDVILIARRPIRGLSYAQIDAVCARLLRKAKLLTEEKLVTEELIPPESSTPDTVNEHA